MHNTLKRTVSLLLAFVMLLGTIPALTFVTKAEAEAAKDTSGDESYDYSSLYAQDGLVFFWSGFDLKEGDSPLTFLENAVGDTDVSLKDSKVYDQYFYTKSVLEFTTFIPHEMTGESNEIFVADDMTFEVVLRQIDEKRPAPTDSSSASIAAAQMNGNFKVPTLSGIDVRAYNMNEISGYPNWQYNYPVDESYGFISDTYATLTPFSGSSSVQLATDVNWSKTKWLGNTRFEPYTVGLRLDYTKTKSDKTLGTIAVDYFRDAISVLSQSGDYDARYYGNWRATSGQKVATKENQVFKFGGLGFGYSAIRFYQRALTEAEITQNHVADLLAYYHVDPALYTGLTDKKKGDATGALAELLIGKTSKEAIVALLEKIAIPSLDEVYMDLYVQDGLIFRWDGFELAFDGSSISSIRSMLGDGKQINRKTTIREATGIGNDGRGEALKNVYSYENSALFAAPYRSDGKSTSLNSQLILTHLIPWSEAADGTSLPSDMTFEATLAYPSVYQTAPDTPNVDNVAGWNGGMVFFGPLGDGKGVGYSKASGNQNKGCAPIVDNETAPLSNWTGALVGLDSGTKRFLGNSLDTAFYTAITFNYDENALDYTSIPYTFKAIRDGLTAMTIDNFYSKDVDYSGHDGTATQMQLTFGLDIATQYYTIRMYDRALNETELQQNHTIDLFKYYRVDVTTYKTLDYKTCERLYEALAPYQIGQTSKEELESILETFAKTGGVLGVIDISDYMSFLGIQARTEDYAALRLRYTVSRDSLQALDDLGASFSFGAMYAKKSDIASKDEMTVEFNRGINEFVKSAGNFTCIPAYHNGEFSEKLDYLTLDSKTIDFGVMLPRVDKDALSGTQVNDEYYVRGYLAVYLNGSHFVMYLDTDDGVFGETVTIAEVSEYFVCNGYASAEIPSLLADETILVGAKVAEELYHEVHGDYSAMKNDIYVLNGSYAGALVSNEEFLKIDAIMAKVNMSAVPLPVTRDQAVEYAKIAATARGELNVYFDLGLKAYEDAKLVADGVAAKLQARYEVAYNALIARGLNESEADEKALYITSALKDATENTVLLVADLDSAYNKLLEIEKKLSTSQAELKLQKIISASSSLFIEGTTVARYTILTSSEYLPAAKALQEFFIAHQGAFVGIYQIDNEYVSGMHDFSGTKAIYVGLTDKQVLNDQSFAVYYDEKLASLCIEGDNLIAVTAGATEFLHRFAIGEGRLRISASDLGTTLINQKYLPMYELNMQTEFPEIKISSVSVDGVWEGFMQRLSEMPAHATVVPKLDLNDFTASQVMTVYVATDGLDSNDGSFEKPFATLERALEAVSYSGGATILLRGGTYPLDTTVTLKAQHSGTITSPLFISNYENEEVLFTTGKTFRGSSLVRAEEASFLPHNALARLNTFKSGNAANVYALDLSTLGITSEDLASYKSGEKSPGLYVGDQSYRVSRWPNIDAPDDKDMCIKGGDIKTMNSKDDVKEVGRVTNGISSLYESHKNNTNEYFEIYIDETTYASHLLAYNQDEVAAKRLWMHGSVYEEWDNLNANMTLHQSGGKNYMKSQARSNYGVKYTADNTVFFYNMLEDLDNKEEYLVDVDNLVLYIYSEESLADRELTLCYASHAALTLSSSNHVVLNGLNFERTYGYGVNMTRCDYALVQDCIFRNLSGYAVEMSDCTQSGVTYSEFYTCNGVETVSSSISTLSPTRNFVQNNRFTNAGDTHAMTVGVRFSGVADVISHNYFYETRLNVQRNYECVIEYNEFDRGPQYNKDTGPIYTNDNSRALHIRYNYLHDLNYSCYGIYLDDMTSGVYVYGNVVHYGDDAPSGGKCVNLHNSSMCVVMNNICIGARDSGILNNINYYATTINGVDTGGGGLGYRFADIIKNRLAVNGNYIAEDVRYSRFPMYAAYTDVVNSVILQMNANPSWHHTNKLSPEEDDELWLRTPLFNIYMNNVFYGCYKGLNIPNVGRSTGRVGANISYDAKTNGIFTDFANGDFSIPADSKIYDALPSFEAVDMSLIGVFAD